MSVETIPKDQAPSYGEIFRGIKQEIKLLINYYFLRLQLAAAEKINQKFPQLVLFDQHGLETRMSEYKTAEEDNCCAEAVKGCLKYLLGANNNKTN